MNSNKLFESYRALGDAKTFAQERGLDEVKDVILKSKLHGFMVDESETIDYNNTFIEELERHVEFLEFYEDKEDT